MLLVRFLKAHDQLGYGVLDRGLNCEQVTHLKLFQFVLDLGELSVTFADQDQLRHIVLALILN